MYCLASQAFTDSKGMIGSQFYMGLDHAPFCYDIPNLKPLSLPTTKIRKAMQNVENGVVWGSEGSLEIAPYDRAQTSISLPYNYARLTPLLGYRDIGQKIAYLNLLCLYLATRWDDIGRISPRSLASVNYECLGYRIGLFA